MACLTLSSDEQYYLSFALRAAATSFRQDAATLSHDHGSFKQLVANFHKAANEAERLAPLIEAADEVHLVTNEKDQEQG